MKLTNSSSRRTPGIVQCDTFGINVPDVEVAQAINISRVLSDGIHASRRRLTSLPLDPQYVSCKPK